VTVRRVLGVTAVAAVALLSAGAFAGAKLGWFAGKPPSDLGFRAGAFAQRDWRPNWVSSTLVPSDAHFVAPLASGEGAAKAWAVLPQVVERMRRARIVTRAPDYLHVEFASEQMGFVDDVEFALDAAGKALHVRSGARMGIRDFGVNRHRVEEIRSGLAAAQRSS
jgi:uncharacterized protein (DUF1499 family)